MSRISPTEARVCRLRSALAERATSTRMDWMHSDSEPDVDEGDGNAHPSSRGA